MAGISASHTVGDFNFAGEASVRDNMPCAAPTCSTPARWARRSRAMPPAARRT